MSSPLQDHQHADRRTWKRCIAIETNTTAHTGRTSRGAEQRPDRDTARTAPRQSGRPAFLDVFSPIAVRVAATLRIADHIDAGLRTRDELAARTATDGSALGRLMRFLACRDVFAEPEPGVYALTDTSRLLLDSHPSRMRHWLDLEGASGRIDLAACGGLLHAVRTGEPGYDVVFGRPFWDDLADQPALAETFNDQMAAVQGRLAPEVAKGYPWKTATRVADIGGGTGALLEAVLKASPGTRGTLVDLGGTVEGGAERFASAGLTGRTDTVGQSFFDPLPAGADVYVLSQILHDWDDRESVKILTRCAEALPPKGRVMVVERVIAHDDGRHLNTEYDLRMLVFNKGKERTLEEFTALATQAGLRLAEVITLPTYHSLLVWERA
ncbi:methyltransferase [Streptomyces sp. NPDC058439]|uniref:methyltransferase n=1 Tax=Streptomyces sp. NPDC058439 TaxID=3346500 RepID=UPI00364ECCCA